MSRAKDDSGVAMDDGLGDMVVSLTRSLKQGDVKMWTNKKDETYIVKGMEKWPTQEDLKMVREITSKAPFPQREWDKPDKACRRTCLEEPVNFTAGNMPTKAELKSLNRMARHPPFLVPKKLAIEAKTPPETKTPPPEQEDGAAGAEEGASAERKGMESKMSEDEMKALAQLC